MAILQLRSRCFFFAAFQPQNLEFIRFSCCVPHFKNRAGGRPHPSRLRAQTQRDLKCSAACSDVLWVGPGQSVCRVNTCRPELTDTPAVARPLMIFFFLFFSFCFVYFLKADSACFAPPPFHRRAFVGFFVLSSLSSFVSRSVVSQLVLHFFFFFTGLPASTSPDASSNNGLSKQTKVLRAVWR